MVFPLSPPLPPAARTVSLNGQYSPQPTPDLSISSSPIASGAVFTLESAAIPRVTLLLIDVPYMLFPGWNAFPPTLHLPIS